MKRNAQSELVGIVILLGISLASIGVIFVLGQPVLTEATDSATVERVQNEMVTMDSRLTAVSQGTSVNESLTFNLEGGVMVSDPDSARLNVTLESGEEIYNNTIGNIEYENGDGAVAYEAGGIWRRNTVTGESFMVSSPDFDFDGETLSLSFYNVTYGSTFSATSTVAVRGGNKTRHATGRTIDQNVTVTVNSDYYQAWGRYLEDELRGNVTVDATEREVKAELLPLRTPNSVDWAGATKTEYERPSSDPFDGDIVEGVEFPSVDSTIESYVEYGRENGGDVTECDDGTVCDGNSPQVYYNNTDYTLENGQFDVTNGDITVVVDGDLTVEAADISSGTGNNVTFVTTGDIKFAEPYTVSISAGSSDPERMVFYAPSDRVVSLVGDGGSGTGTIYAPDALVSLRNMGDSTWTGSVVAEVFDAGGVDSDAEINFGSSVNVERADSNVSLYVLERRVGIE